MSSKNLSRRKCETGCGKEAKYGKIYGYGNEKRCKDHKFDICV